VQTIPKRGYRFIAPVDAGARGAHAPAPAPASVAAERPRTDLTLTLQKVLWSNIAELRMAEAARARRRRTTTVALVCGVVVLAIAAIARFLLR